MEWIGWLAGSAMLVAMGLFQPLVGICAKTFSWRFWPVFFAIGLIAWGLSLAGRPVWSLLWGVVGAACFWGVGELQEGRVELPEPWKDRAKDDAPQQLCQPTQEEKEQQP